MSANQDILSKLDFDQIAGVLGTSPEEARQAATSAVDSLLTGMQSNSDVEEGATRFANALGQHVSSPVLSSDGTVDLDAVDVEDGSKIVDHVLAPQALASAGSSSLVSKLLPMLAPIVMAYLAQRLTGGLTSKASGSQASAGGGLGDILGQVLGGHTQASSGGGLGDILGQVLGGQTQASSGGGLGDILGQVLGGQTKASVGTSAGKMSDPGASSASDSLGGLLQNILFGR